MLFLAVTAAIAAQDCEFVTATDIVAVAPPAVIVLGERRGTQPDLWRATRTVRRLGRRAPVTVALQAINEQQGPILQRYANGAVLPGDLPELIAWDQHWGFEFAPYRGLVTAASWGANVVPVGMAPTPRPVTAILPMPPNYMFVLGEAMKEGPVPVELESVLTEFVAWQDHRIAANAISAWDGQGYLVIVADRFHVEGGKGVGWQAARLTEHSVHSFLLADAGALCTRDDRVWR